MTYSLKLVGLKEKYYKQSPFELSGGQKRRVAIAGVLAMRPEVLILDEPTAGLDPRGRDEILDLVNSLQDNRGMTIILVSHSMEDVAKYADRLMVMSGGEKVFGKVFKPADGNGNYPDSLGALPLVVFFHEPLKTEWPESLIKSLVPKGVIGYTCGFRSSDKDAESLVKRLRKEKMVMDDMVFIISDSACGNEVVKAVTKLGHKIQGLVLIEPSLTGKARETYVRYAREFLTVNESSKSNAASMIEDYLEERGALK